MPRTLHADVCDMLWPTSFARSDLTHVPAPRAAQADVYASDPVAYHCCVSLPKKPDWGCARFRALRRRTSR